MRRALLLSLLLACHGKNDDDSGAIIPPDDTGGGDTGDPTGTDADGDGWTVEDGDCDDANADVNPGAEDLPCTGVAEDCTGTDGDLFVPQDHATIQEAVDAAPDGAWICVDEGTWDPVTIDHPLSLAALPGEVVISGGGATTPVVVQADDVTVRGFTITGGLWGDSYSEGSLSGGGMQLDEVDSAQVLENRFHGNEGYAGGGVFVRGGGEVLFADNEFSDNTASLGGGIALDETDTVTLRDNSFSGNSATGTPTEGSPSGGGGAVVGVELDTLTLNANHFDTNTATGWGGAAWITATSALFSDDTWTGNSAYLGGGFYLEAPLQISLDGESFTDNTATDSMPAAALLANGAATPVAITDTTVSDNVCEGTGSSIFFVSSADTLQVQGLHASGNSGGSALTVVGVGTLSVSDSTFQQNTDDDGTRGGALQLDTLDTATVDNCEFTENAISGEGVDLGDGGGAIYATSVSQLDLHGSTFSDNSSGANGGALCVSSGNGVTLDQLTFSGNQATAGGAVIIQVTDVVNATDLDISGNQATESGGGLKVNLASAISVASSTIIGNQAGTRGGGVSLDTAFATAGSVAIATTEIRDNSAGDLGGGAFISNTDFALDDADQIHDNSPDQVYCSTTTGCTSY